VDTPLTLTLFLFLGSAVLIYLSCKFFVNGVEWVGARLNVSQTATGTILAAFGTALPESVVTFVAIAFGTTPAEREIGVGAAMGGPLVLNASCSRSKVSRQNLSSPTSCAPTPPRSDVCD
jgi:cation:H+ antiporter